MTFFFRCKDRNLRMEDSSRNRYWLYLVVLADAMRSLLAQACTNSLNVGENKRFTSATAYKRIKNDGLEKRKTERVRRENPEAPGISRYQTQRRQSYDSISGQYRCRTHHRHLEIFVASVSTNTHISVSQTVRRS